MILKADSIQQVDARTAEALRVLRDFFGQKPPKEVAPEQSLDDRRRFIMESRESLVEGAIAYERIIAGDDLQPVAYLERGAIAARAVARIVIRNQFGRDLGSGTGFLIAPRVLITNNHVLKEASTCLRSTAQFAFETDVDGNPIGPVEFALAPDELFHTNIELDFTVVAVKPVGMDSRSRLEAYGFLPLLPTVGKVAEGEWLSIIQHPDGQRKQICVRENRLLKREGNVLWYSTDTKPGSSGSPVFSNDWLVVALHHAGVPEKRNGVNQTVDGRDFDPATMRDDQIKWIGNEGIRASVITKHLLEQLPEHALLRPLFEATPASGRVDFSFAPDSNRILARRESNVFTVTQTASSNMTTTQTITVPIEIKLSISDGGRVVAQGATESAPAMVFEASKRKESAREAPFDSDYTKRKGYDEKFLGGGDKIVGLPLLGAQNEKNAAPLFNPVGANKNVLHYDNYSVVMNKRRRFAFYSAANVSFSDRYEMARARDVWRRDPRIDAEHQIEAWYYLKNQFDRGHLTRREDLEFGATPKIALMSAGDTCHWTNCTPQHAKFNQNKEIWQGIERHVLEDAIWDGQFNAQVITGPVFDEGDPEYQDIQYSLQYWKIVAALKSGGELFATAYIASQEDVIAEFGIDEAAIPFTPYKTFQTSIAEIERLTGLTFVSGVGGKTPLRNFDPLARPGRKPRRPSGSGAHESTRARALPDHYREIGSLEDIVL